MRYQYVVILKKESERATDAFSILLCLFSALSFGYMAAHQGVRFSTGQMGTGYAIGGTLSTYILAVLALVLLIGPLALAITRRRAQVGRRSSTPPDNGPLLLPADNPLRPVRYRFWLLIAAIGWIGLTPTPWVGAIFFLLSFLEYQTKRPLEIGFDHDRIVMNTLFKRQFDWSVLNNVILKDGLLTLDFKNNKLIQKMVADDDDEDDADEEEFNTYCRSRLTAVSTNS
jgi:uncharacterized membrane protein YhaH (DUF805 family)